MQRPIKELKEFFWSCVKKRLNVFEYFCADDQNKPTKELFQEVFRANDCSNSCIGFSYAVLFSLFAVKFSGISAQDLLLPVLSKQIRLLFDKRPSDSF